VLPVMPPALTPAVAPSPEVVPVAVAPEEAPPLAAAVLPLAPLSEDADEHPASKTRTNANTGAAPCSEPYRARFITCLPCLETCAFVPPKTLGVLRLDIRIKSHLGSRYNSARVSLQTDKSAMMAAAVRAPLNRRASLPSRKRIIVGMLRMSNRAATLGAPRCPPLRQRPCQRAARRPSRSPARPRGTVHTMPPRNRQGPAPERRESTRRTLRRCLPKPDAPPEGERSCKRHTWPSLQGVRRGGDWSWSKTDTERSWLWPRCDRVPPRQGGGRGALPGRNWHVRPSTHYGGAAKA